MQDLLIDLVGLIQQSGLAHIQPFLQNRSRLGIETRIQPSRGWMRKGRVRQPTPVSNWRLWYHQV
jgi:hypothetical protein